MATEANDQKRFGSVVESLSTVLSLEGLRPIKFKQHDTWDDGWWAPAASWGNNRPRVGVWFDYLLDRNKRRFWFGFYSAPPKLDALVKEIQDISPNPIILTVSQDDVQGMQLAQATISKAKQERAIVYEQYSEDWDDFRYLGKFEGGFPATSDDGTLVGQAANFVLEIVRLLEPLREEESDIDELKRRGDLTTTERHQLILARRGQGIFREKLFHIWGGCAVTGCNVTQVLRASHIQPWKASTDEERLDGGNGLLLTATLDALFDKGLISFDDAGKMLISNHLAENERTHVLPKQINLRRPLSDRQKKYLRTHRIKTFVKSEADK